MESRELHVCSYLSLGGYSLLLSGLSPGEIVHGRCGLGGVCDHVNPLGYHIKEMCLLKTWKGGTPLIHPYTLFHRNIVA